MAIRFDDLPDEAPAPAQPVAAAVPQGGLSFDDLPDEPQAAAPAQQSAAPQGLDPMELYRGAARSVDQMGLAAGRILGIPAAQTYDTVRGIFTDDDPYQAQNALREHVLNPLQQRADSLAPAPDASFGNKLMNAGGGFGGNLLAMLATGGLSRATAALPAATPTSPLPGVATQLGQAAKTMAVPAATDAINTGHDVTAETGSIPQGLKAAIAAGAGDVAMGIIPANLPGNLATRLATGAPIGALTGEASRQLRNAAVPASMQTPFNAQDAMVNAAMGSVLGGALGRAPEQPSAPVQRIQPEAMPTPAPEQIAPQAAPEPVPQPLPKTPFAGSQDVRPLFESMGMGQQEMDSSLALLADDAPDIEAARRGSISWEETGRLAALTGTTVEKLRKHRLGIAFNAEEQVAATRLLKDQTLKTMDLSQKVSSGTATEIEQANFLQSLNDLRTTQRAVMASRAEIGRSFSTMRADVTTMKQAGNMLDAVGGAQGAKAIADALTNAARVGGVEAANKLARQAGSDGFWTFYKSMLLSSPDTHFVNVISNLATSLMQVPTRAMAGGIGAAKRMVGLNGETRIGESVYQLGGMLEGAINGARGAVSSWKTGEDAFGNENKAEVYRTDYPGQKVWGVPLRALQSEDQFFKYLNDGMARYAVAYRMAAQELKGQGPAAVHKRVQEIIADPPKELVEAGEDAALFHTFNNRAGKITQAVNNLRHALPYGTGNLVVPFLKTPANLITYAAKHSPAAPIFKQVREDLHAGGARQEEALARMGIGSLLISLGAVGSMASNLTGGGPSDPEERRAWLAAGNQPYSLKVNGRWHQYSRIEPMATLVGIAADVASGAQKQELGFSELIKAIGRNFTSKTWLQGLSGVMQAMSDPDRYGGSWVNRSAATLAQPVTALSHLGRYLDPYQRETDRDSFMGQLAYRLPVLRETLPIKRDQFGQPLMEPQRQIGRAGPIPSTVPSDDPLRVEAGRLGWAPQPMKRSFTLKATVPGRRSEKIELTLEQQNELNELANSRMHAEAKALVQSPLWKTLDDDERVEALDKIMSGARSSAKKAFTPYLRNGARGAIDLYRNTTAAKARGRK